MIRIVVMVLAAANLLYLGWTQWARNETPRLVTPAVATAGNPAVVPTPPHCTTLGPFHTDVRALEFEQALGEMRIAPVRRTVTESLPDGWWVYVASADAPAQARALRSIQAAGVRDAFLMRDDPQFRVSVGLFTDEAGARRLAEAVRMLRLDAVVSPRTQQRNATWFDMPGVATGAVELARFAAAGLDVQQLQLLTCPEPAAAAGEAAAPAPAPL